MSLEDQDTARPADQCGEPDPGRTRQPGPGLHEVGYGDLVDDCNTTGWNYLFSGSDQILFITKSIIRMTGRCDKSGFDQYLERRRHVHGTFVNHVDYQVILRSRYYHERNVVKLPKFSCMSAYMLPLSSQDPYLRNL